MTDVRYILGDSAESLRAESVRCLGKRPAPAPAPDGGLFREASDA